MKFFLSIKVKGSYIDQAQLRDKLLKLGYEFRKCKTFLGEENIYANMNGSFFTFGKKPAENSLIIDDPGSKDIIESNFLMSVIPLIIDKDWFTVKNSKSDNIFVIGTQDPDMSKIVPQRNVVRAIRSRLRVLVRSGLMESRKVNGGKTFEFRIIKTKKDGNE